LLDVKYCFYINLQRRPDRRKFIESQLEKSPFLKGIFQRFEAVDGLNVNPRDLEEGFLTENAIEDILSEEVVAWGLSMTQGALGVLLTYRKLFERISGLDSCAILFEDDVEIDGCFDEKLKDILSELPDDFDYCYVGRGEDEIQHEQYSQSLVVPKGVITCLPSLIVSPAGAKKLLERLKGVDHQIDSFMYMKREGLNVFCSKQRLVKIKNEFTTDIQGRGGCVKNYRSQNYIFATIACGEDSSQKALKFALDLNHFGQKILIVTDRRNTFKSCENVVVVDYPDKQFSYNDKIICFEEGFRHADAVVYADADCRICYESFKSCYANLKRIAPPGFHPSWDWGKIIRDEGKFFKGTDIPNRSEGYGELAREICHDLRIPVEDAFHYQEGVLILSKDEDKHLKLLETWRVLADKLDSFEIESGSPRIGAGEGNLFGLAVAKSGIKINSHDFANLIGRDVKYNFYGDVAEDFFKRNPNRRILIGNDGRLVANRTTQVKFQDKDVNLSFSVYELNDGLCSLNFKWNANSAVEFLDHEFEINGDIYHFNSQINGEFYFKKGDPTKINHTYDWYGEKNWSLVFEF